MFCLIQLLAKESDRIIFLAQYTIYLTRHILSKIPLKNQKDENQGNSQLPFNFLQSLRKKFSPLELHFLKTINNWSHNSIKSPNKVA